MFCRKLEYPDKTTDILPITDKYYSLKLYKLLLILGVNCLSVTYDWSVVFSGDSGFLHQ